MSPALPSRAPTTQEAAIALASTLATVPDDTASHKGWKALIGPLCLARRVFSLPALFAMLIVLSRV